MKLQDGLCTAASTGDVHKETHQLGVHKDFFGDWVAFKHSMRPQEYEADILIQVNIGMPCPELWETYTNNAQNLSVPCQ